MAGKRARCKCGVTLSIPAPKAKAPAPEPSVADSNAISVRCPGCGRQHRAGAAMAGKSARCACGTVLEIPDPMGTSGVGSILDELTDEELNPTPAPQPQTPAKPKRSDWEVLAQYTDVNAARASGAKKKDYQGAFAPEQRGLDYGVLGGLVMMGIAAVWFFGGLACGIIFFYPPILFLIGLFGFLKGLFTGNVAGK